MSLLSTEGITAWRGGLHLEGVGEGDDPAGLDHRAALLQGVRALEILLGDGGLEVLRDALERLLLVPELHPAGVSDVAPGGGVGGLLPPEDAHAEALDEGRPRRELARALNAANPLVDAADAFSHDVSGHITFPAALDAEALLLALAKRLDELGEAASLAEEVVDPDGLRLGGILDRGSHFCSSFLRREMLQHQGWWCKGV
mmetsp:Transcript_55814/g.131986  ORF Transcript_55814/g.131986 Transcript_55814/m.131986 type:complete len:201 (+) Transcript_55814:46-648(+)